MIKKCSNSDRHGSQPMKRELEREAIRVFRRLQKKHVLLETLDNCLEPGYFGIIAASNGSARCTLKVEAKYVQTFADRGWIERQGNGYSLSADGAAWLRRRAAKSDPFQEQHQLRSFKAGPTRSGDLGRVTINEGESPLGWLHKRKDRNGNPLIDVYQFDAGERLRADYWRAQLVPSVTSNWSLTVSSKRVRRSPPNDPGACTDVAIAAKKRLVDALNSVGPELSGILIDVCCNLQGLEDAEKNQGWPQRSGKIVLQLALTRLARHYGLISKTADPCEGRNRITAWGSADYKPSIDRWL